MIHKNASGVWLSKALFTNFGISEYTRYTLGRENVIKDGVVYQSFDTLYLEIADPTEYEVSKLFGSWDHWKTIAESPSIKPYVDGLREELTMRLRSQGIKEIIKKAKGDKGFTAAKYLADKSWVKDNKIERVKKSKEQLRIINDFNEDLKRIGAHAH
jgi:hypothetical protein